MSDESAPKRRRWPRILAWILGGLAIVLVLVGAALTMVLRGSLPTTTGELTVEGLSGPVTIERDARGVPTFRAADRADIAFAMGFAHGQERFFQMDLMRRASAGELSALFGERAVDFDTSRRIHRSRHVAEQALKGFDAENRALVERYAAGVNAGLDALDADPFEYQLLRVDPRPWAPVDTALVILAMFYDLQDETASYDRRRAVMREALPLELAEWLMPRSNPRWDAPVDGGALPVVPMPGPEAVDLRTMPQWEALRRGEQSGAPVRAGQVMMGSNSWAVAGARSRHGGALVANDMHLSLRVPIIWYRAALEWTDGETARRVEGVSLPGGPVIVVGSNGHIAWAFTNSQIDSVDAIPLEVEGDTYRTPEGPRPFVTHTETIEVAGGDPVTMAHRWTIWGPVVDAEHGRPTAIRWVGHEPEALNLTVRDLEATEDLDAALAVAHRGGTPPQNFIVGDHTGRIGWTIFGYVPERFGPAPEAPAAPPAEAAAPEPPEPPEPAAPDAPPAEAAEPPAPPLWAGFDGRIPRAWADGDVGWKGRLPAERYPRIVDPPGGLLWNGNGRMVGGEAYALLGETRYALGPRQKQIRDGLRTRAAERTLTEDDMLAIQLDDRALFLTPWRVHLQELLAEAEPTPLRTRAKHHLDTGWTGRASVGSVGYRLVHDLRLAILRGVFGALTAPAVALHPDFAYAEPGAEGPLWEMVTTEPAHLLHPKHPTWADWQLALIDGALARLTEGAPDPVAALDQRTWGEANRMAVRHPMAGAVPVFGDALGAPRDPLPGDSHMPRVQSSSAGASERLAVSPGKEDQGYLLLPGGQSGHPLSPHFLDQYRAWAAGDRQPFQPGQTRQTLTLRPPG